METHPFSKAFLNQIQNHLEKIMENSSGPYYAAFDADGTLWNEDIGEKFFQYQIDHCFLPELEKKDPWEYYLKTKKKTPEKLTSG